MKFYHTIYSLLTKEETPINMDDEIVVQKLPQNFCLSLLSNLLTQTSDSLASTKTVLVWLMNSLGVPVFLTSLLVPIRESGSMLPQAFFSRWMTQKERRIPIWLSGAVVQSLSLVIIGFSSMYLEGTVIGLITVFFVGIFSLGRSLSSLSSKDIMGRTIPKNQRGSLNGYSQTISSIVILLVGLYFQYTHFDNFLLSWLLIGAGILWLCAFLVYQKIYEPSVVLTSTLHQKNKTNIFRRIFSLLKKDVPFRNFIIARSLLLSTALITPFFVTLIQQSHVEGLAVLGLIIIVTGIAGIVSSPLWGYMADYASNKVMSLAGFLSAVTTLLVVLLLSLNIHITDSYWFYLVVLFLSAIAHGGVRIGRKTYVVNLGEGDKRIYYVSTSNTIIAILLLFVGLLTSLLSLFSIVSALLTLGVMACIGAYLSYRLPEIYK